MENPIILITSSEEQEDKEERTIKWRSKVEEYRTISDLSGFENLKAMMEAEGSARRKKRNRAKKRRNGAFCEDEYRIISDLSDFHNLKAMKEDEALMRRNKMEKKRKLESCDQQDVTVNAAKETEQLGKNEAVKMIEASKPGSVQIDNANEKEDASTITSVETMKGIGTDDGVNSSEGIDLCSPPSGADQVISHVSCCRGVEDTVGAVVEVKKKRRRRKKTKRVTAQDKVGDAKEEDTKDNIVLRMLLRKPRYFDPPDCNWVTFSNCGKENRTATSCKTQKRKKPCFLCGSFKHIWKYCRQGQDCFIRNGIDHLAHNCPKTDQMNNSGSNICLRCGDSEHDMFSCRGDYAADDLKEIQCYICRSFGHLCCVVFPDTAQKQVSCYNCGQSGHLGSACPNSCEAPSGTNPSVACYKCGEKGHIVRRCGTNSKDRPGLRLRISDMSPRAKSLSSKSMNHTGFPEYHPNFVG